MRKHRWGLRAACAILGAATLLSCGGGSASGNGTTVNNPAPSRSFLMGSTPFEASVNGTAVVFPDWKFENLPDRDLLSLHVDDFWGVPWDACNATACSNLPPAWVAQWQQLASNARAAGKPIYLALSPLTNRRTLANKVLANGAVQGGWTGQDDANGCYRFATDPAAASYKAKYISYLKYLVNLVGPSYLSPAVEMNMPFASCPSQKTAWIAWYADVHAAIKTAYPALVVFPTFQMESMYGVASADSKCPGASFTQCFDQRLAEALSVPGDRLAFSTYPIGWRYVPDFNYAPPTDTYARAHLATSRKIWVSETGWTATPLLTHYAHGTTGTCGAVALPATLNWPGQSAPLDTANEAAQSAYLANLLTQAQAQGLEAVVWWLNRDYLDASVAQTCPCAPSNNATCVMAQSFYDVGADSGEYLLRAFGNMGLRRVDGSARPAQAVWAQWVARTYQP